MPEKTDKTKKYRIRAIAIISMLVLVLLSVTLMQYYLCIPSEFDEDRVLNLHKQPENSIDVLMVGSSATQADFASVYAYDKYGFTSYPYSLDGATCAMWKPALQDALRTQKPKLVVVDIFGGGYDTELMETRSNQEYIIMTHVPLSREKIEMAKDIHRNAGKSSVASLIFPFIKYHSNVPSNLRTIKNRLKAEFSEASPLKGIETLARDRDLAYVDEASFTSDTAELDANAERMIREFIDYCKEKDLKVLFVKYPSVLTENDPDEMLVNLRANRILEIAEENGYPTLNMQPLFRELGLQEKKDFYNHGHANVRGQKKITDYLGRYIQEEMGIGPSELSAESKADWDNSVRYYNALVQMTEEFIRGGNDISVGDSPDSLEMLEKYMKEHDL
ncbi:MAG: hypothetical protein J6D57_07370 [Mogibacterium sp.]|nr:hypothetical protein [Mogibacterium sp.]